MKILERVKAMFGMAEKPALKSVGWEWSRGNSPLSNWPTPGTHFDYKREVGELYHNSAYMACLRWAFDNFAEAPPCLKEKDEYGEKQRLENPTGSLLTLLETLEEPNQDYDDTVLWAGTLLDFIGPGNAYWLPAYDNTGAPREFQWIPQRLVRPMPPNNPRPGDRAVDHYEYLSGGTWQRVEVEEIIHFRWGADPWAPYKGIGRGEVLLREIFADNAATNYTANILRNSGSIGGVASPKPNANGVYGADFDPEEFVKRFNMRHTGDNVGKMLAVDVPLELQWPNNTPESMALDTIRQYPESRVCAVVGIPGSVVGLMIGHVQKTYSNYGEARSAAWEEFMLPLMRVLSRQATRQIVRRMSGVPRTVYFGFDYSEVRALQEDQDALHTRVREDYKVGLIDKAQALGQIGMQAKPEDEGMYFTPPAAPEAEVEEDEKPKPNGNGRKPVRTGKRYDLKELEAFKLEYAGRALARREAYEAEFGAMDDGESEG